jgi:hypothetical protein
VSTERRPDMWRSLALLGIGLWVGYVAAQVIPTATAQQGSGVLRVQLDTSNCVSVVGGFAGTSFGDGLFEPIELEGLVLPGGNEVRAIVCR